MRGPFLLENRGKWPRNSAAVLAILIVAPIVPMCAALLVTIASFTRSFKEAQTYISLLMLVPMIPGIAIMPFPITPSVPVLAIPFLSQILLVTELIKGEPLHLSWAVSSVFGSLTTSLFLTWVAVRLYRREGLLG